MSKQFVFTEKELPQRSPEWKAQRQTVVGGSDVATILGLMEKYEKPKTRWKRETGRLKPKTENFAMKRGAEMEDEAKKVIIKHLKDVEGIKKPKLEMFFAKHPDFPEVGVSFDGVDLKNNYIVEIKCPNYSSVFRSVFEDGIQEYYYPQVQLQLAVANALWGINKAYFCSYFPDGVYVYDHFDFIERLKTLAVIDVDYDEHYFREMVKVIKVYRKFVELNTFDDKLFKEATLNFKKQVNK